MKTRRTWALIVVMDNQLAFTLILILQTDSIRLGGRQHTIDITTSDITDTSGCATARCQTREDDEANYTGQEVAARHSPTGSSLSLTVGKKSAEKEASRNFHKLNNTNTASILLAVARYVYLSGVQACQISGPSKEDHHLLLSSRQAF
ncbi:hypothetical protein V8F33_002159 [Rhypophila sp. PSN 637]